jgi:hypothetical protein
LDPLTRQRLYGPKPPGVDEEAWADTTMWVDPNHSGGTWMYEWYDAKAGGGCGSIADWMSGSLASREAEIHDDGGVGLERHCLVPGTYQFQLRQGGVAGSIVREFKIAYVPSARGVTVSNTTANCTESVRRRTGATRPRRGTTCSCT